MTMTLRLPDGGASPIAFGCSAAYEALRSLHVLCDAKHHPLHLSWVLDARGRMGPEIRDEAEAFGFWFTGRPLLFDDIWPLGEPRPWADALFTFLTAPVEHFAEPLIQRALGHGEGGSRADLATFRGDPALQAAALETVDARHPASVPVLRELIADPDACRERFVMFLSVYWEACLAPEWSTLEAHLLTDITRRGRALSRRGVVAMLEELSPHVKGRANEVVIRSPDARADVEAIELSLAGDDQILLLPSHFTWPELTVALREDRAEGHERRHEGCERRTVLVMYALEQTRRQGRAPMPPPELLKMLRSAGDRTRLQVLQLLASRPRSTREIAGLIGFTEAAISKHLKLLQDAGWLRAERRGYYVYYHLVPDAPDRVTQGVEELLR